MAIERNLRSFRSRLGGNFPFICTDKQILSPSRTHLSSNVGIASRPDFQYVEKFDASREPNPTATRANMNQATYLSEAIVRTSPHLAYSTFSPECSAHISITLYVSDNEAENDTSGDIKDQGHVFLIRRDLASF